ncbi:MAG: GNAT family N-acetyltransferase [Anaerolineae bacterium]|nr:GNAT family N-acetyltransferase [Anaerolineae bacterium]
MNLTIVPFTLEHYEPVIALWRHTEGVGLSSADSRENIRAYLERNVGMSFIAQNDGVLVGAVLSGHDGRRGYIHHLAVHPEYRRRGIGRQLVERCLSALQAAGIQKCHLFIFQQNVDGIRFWESIGWSRRVDIGVISKTIAGTAGG